MPQSLRVCVFCGSSLGARPSYRSAAAALARELVTRGCDLVYGGAHRGLMGLLADEVLTHGGRVTGVLPEALASKEIAHHGIQDLRIVSSMHARKQLMSELSDAFVALPGGFGTLDELMEILTWAQLGMHNKPIGLLNIGGYFEPLTSFLDHAVAEGFVDADARSLLIVETEPKALLDHFLRHLPP